MRVEVFKTHEVPNSLWGRICEGFNECFEGLHVSEETLKQGFCVSTFYSNFLRKWLENRRWRWYIYSETIPRRFPPFRKNSECSKKALFRGWLSSGNSGPKFQFKGLRNTD